MSDWDDLKIPFGQTADGRMVSPTEVERGTACGCICPQCGLPLVAKKGDVLRHHFAHSSEGCGSGALETSLHKMAKQIIADARKVWTPELMVYMSLPKEYIEVRRDVCKEAWATGDVTLEERFADFQPDAVIHSTWGAIGVEIFVSHAVDATKREKIKTAQLPTIEIDLSDYDRNISLVELTHFVLRGAPRFWVFHPREAIARESANRELTYLLKEKAERRAEADRRHADLIEKGRLEHIERQQQIARRQAEFEQRERTHTISTVRWEDDAARDSTSPLVSRNNIPLSGYLQVARIRPSQWDGLTNFPTKGAVCSDCGNSAWRRTTSGWGCTLCAPAELHGRTAA